MQTIKLHEATKQFGISNKLAMFFLEKKNIPVKSHSSVISMEQLELLREFAGDKDKKAKFGDIYNEFNRIEKEKKKRAKQVKAAKERGETLPPEPLAPPEPPKAAEPKPEPKPEPEQEPITAPRSELIPAAKPEPTPEPKPEPTPAPEPEPKPEPTAAPKPEPPKAPVVDAKPVPPRDVEPRKEAHAKREAPPRKAPEQKPAPAAKHPKQEPAKARDTRKPQQQRTPGGKPSSPSRPGDRQRSEPPRGRGGQNGNRGRQHQQSNKGGKRHDRNYRPAPSPPPPPKPKPKPKVYNLPELIRISNFITIKELADRLNLKLKDIEERMGMLKNDYVTNRLLDVEDIKAICDEFKVEVDITSYEDSLHFEEIEKSKAQLVSRAPVVTVMGHVDHGKTTLLDTLRNSRIAAREAGGITQKIGAYKLSSKGKDIIFLDTPGHEAFTNIRARGAKVTDIVILVVAANDGVKPQTIEAINHAQAAEVPIVVAINKIDLPGADPNKVKQELTQHNIVVEDWGGDVVSVEISAKNNENLDALLEMIHLVSEMLELKAYNAINARGAIIEAHLDPKLGPMGTVLVQHGRVKRGDFFICGNAVGKIKSIFDDQGKALNEAEGPIPVEIMGFETVPEAGERFQVVADVEKARKVISMRNIQDKEAKSEEVTADKKLSLQNLFERLEESKTKTFPIIIKTDNFSSCEVLENILLKQSHDKLKINIIHKGIGNVTESDILLASTSNSIIVGFNVKAPQKIMGLAKREQTEIRMYNVIYHLIEDIEKAIKGEIEPEFIETHIGKVEVLQVFKISKLGNIAGCLVKEGKVTRNSKLKVFRNNDFVFEGELETLRRVKNEASEVNAGTECGIKIKNFNDIAVGDILEVYELKEKKV